MMDMSAEQRHVLPVREDGHPYTFMIVDDSEFMISNLKRLIIGFEGKIVETATDGATAVIKYRGLEPKPDLITMDITMPQMNGLDAIKMILKDNPTQKIVVVSALGHKEAVRDAIVSGAKHFIGKPFARDSVYKVFRAVLGIRTAL